MNEEGTWFAYADMVDGVPHIFYETEFLGTASPAFQAHVMAHECAHHQNGDLYETNEGSPFSDKNIRIEDSADCAAVEYLVTEKGFGQAEVDLIKSNYQVFIDYIKEHSPNLAMFARGKIVKIQQCYDVLTP